MTPAKLPRILCVDDEPNILNSIVVALRRDYDVQIATNGEEALRLLAEGGYALVCSDMRMPGMTGIELLKRVMQLHPEVTRILLTGETGRDTAVDAVNEGQIFRFLTKPCPADKLKAAIDAGVAQHRLVSAERVLLQETLIGCIKALVDVLAITHPVAFGRASRVKSLAKEFAHDLGYRGFWQLEAAALLSQLGYLSLPVELVEKLYNGQLLTPDEKTLVSGVPDVAKKLLAHIPRLEPVTQILAGLNTPNNPKLPQGTLQKGSQILALILDFDSLVAQGLSPPSAIEQLKRRDGKHDLLLVEKLSARVGAGAGGEEVRQLPLHLVQPGMIFMDELRSEFGVLLVPKGYEVTESFLTRIRNFSAKVAGDEVRVMIKSTPQG